MTTSDLDAKLISQGTQVSSVDGAALVPVATAEGQPQNNITVEGLADSMGAQAAESVNITSLWGQTEDGKMVRITNQSVANIIGNLLYESTNKNDLASVVAEVMTSSTLFPFMAKGVISDETSIDSTQIKSGFYQIQGLNSTSYCPVQYGLLIVYSYSLMRVQIAIAHKGASVYSRSNWNSEGWSDWRRMDSWGHNTLEELASSVAEEIGTVSVSKKGLAKSTMCNYSWTPTSSLNTLRIKVSKRFCSLSLLVNAYVGGHNVVHFVNVGFANEGVLYVKNNGTASALCTFKFNKSGYILITTAYTSNTEVEIVPLNYITGLTYEPLSSSDIDTSSYIDATIIE